MTTFFVTRHAGAIDWAQRRGLQVDRQVSHLEATDVAAGDVVIGSLPVHLAGQICQRGAQYLHLSLDLPAAARGRELSADELDAYGARLEAFEVLPEGHTEREQTIP
jgi:CRISPR-associated protein Csx16